MRTMHNVIQRVRAEYLEMPGLRLRAEQVQRLCGIDPATCQTVLDALVNAMFLCVKPDGHYARLTEGPCSRPHPAKAVLRIERCAMHGHYHRGQKATAATRARRRAADD
jgi:hypothetical protein